MANIFSEEGSLKFKELIDKVRNLVPTLTNINTLNKVRNVIIEKQEQLKNVVDNPNISQNQKQTIKDYLDKSQEVLNLINARITGMSSLGGKRRKSRKSRKGRKGRKGRKSRKSIRRPY
jgi:hypothetical protein